MKKFLTTFAGIAAAFASNASTAPASTASMAPTVDGQNIAAPKPLCSVRTSQQLTPKVINSTSF